MHALPLPTTPDSVCRSENDVTLAGPSMNQTSHLHLAVPTSSPIPRYFSPSRAISLVTLLCGGRSPLSIVRRANRFAVLVSRACFILPSPWITPISSRIWPNTLTLARPPCLMCHKTIQTISKFPLLFLQGVVCVQHMAPTLQTG